MSQLLVNVPESLHKNLQSLADREGISVDQFVSTCIAEKLAVLMTDDYLAERARRASRERYEAALSKVSNVDPEEYDKLPSE